MAITFQKNQLNSCTMDLTDFDRIKEITRVIRDADIKLRNQYKVLRYQDMIGLFIFLCCAGFSITCGALYFYGVISWWICIPISAFFLSIIREIEHDLIHKIYFKSNIVAHNLMMFFVWFFLGNLPHPWYRRRMHLLHHRKSGNKEDFEERLIGNGLEWGLLKILAMVAPELAFIFRQKEFHQITFYKFWPFVLSFFPIGIAYYLLLYGCVALNFFSFAVGGLSDWPAALLFISVLNSAAVIYVYPNLLRQVSVQILSSILHYHGDVESRLHETQVLKNWWTFPLQLLSCNFGSTHTIHHFVVTQPFYLRLLVSKTAEKVLDKFGVRKNDSLSVFRANKRFSMQAQAK